MNYDRTYNKLFFSSTAEETGESIGEANSRSRQKEHYQWEKITKRCVEIQNGCRKGKNRKGITSQGA